MVVGLLLASAIVVRLKITPGQIMIKNAIQCEISFDDLMCHRYFAGVTGSGLNWAFDDSVDWGRV
jgi:hypothetical protein